MPQLPDESVDLVVTSPPYNLLNSTGNGSRCWDGYDGHSDDMPHHAYVEWQRLCLVQMLRVLKPDGAIFYNHMHRVQGGLIVRHDDILQDFPLRQVIIWHRSGGTNFNPGYFLPDYEVIYLVTKPKFRLLDGHTDGSVWRIHQETCSWITGIPTFPVDLPRRAIRATSAQVMLDPFMGSGTTAVAAVLEGRRCCSWLTLPLRHYAEENQRNRWNGAALPQYVHQITFIVWNTGRHFLLESFHREYLYPNVDRIGYVEVQVFDEQVVGHE